MLCNGLDLCCIERDYVSVIFVVWVCCVAGWVCHWLIALLPVKIFIFGYVFFFLTGFRPSVFFFFFIIIISSLRAIGILVARFKAVKTWVFHSLNFHETPLYVHRLYATRASMREVYTRCRVVIKITQLKWISVVLSQENWLELFIKNYSITELIKLKIWAIYSKSNLTKWVSTGNRYQNLPCF